VCVSLAGLESAHHPFTAPLPSDTELVYTDPPAVSCVFLTLLLLIWAFNQLKLFRQLENVGSRIDMQTHTGNGRTQGARRRMVMQNMGNGHYQLCDRDGFRNRVTLTFDLWVNACRATATAYTCTKFGVDSSSHFLECGQRDRQTRLNALPTRAAMPLWVIS